MYALAYAGSSIQRLVLWVERIHEANRTHAFKMIKKGYSDEAISEIIECSVLDVQALRKEYEEKISHQ